VAPPEPPYQPDEIYDALQQGDKLTRLGGLRVLRIDGEVFVNGEKINSPHRPALDALATHLTLNAEHLGDALEDPPSSPCWPRWSTAATGSLRTESSTAR
jgi:50S ribosomal protein L16 3-hydroxylase